jgi:hypothetical protein
MFISVPKVWLIVPPTSSLLFEPSHAPGSAQKYLSAVSAPVAIGAVSGPRKHGTGKSREPAGWKACATFSPRSGSWSRCAVEKLSEIRSRREPFAISQRYKLAIPFLPEKIVFTTRKLS